MRKRSRVTKPRWFLLTVFSLVIQGYALGDAAGESIQIEGERVNLPAPAVWEQLKTAWLGKLDMSTFSVEERKPEYLSSYFVFAYSLALKRANAQGRETPNDGDMELVFEFLCNIPLPVKPPEEQKLIREARRRAVTEILSTGQLQVNPFLATDLFLEGSREEILTGVEKSGMSAVFTIR